MHAENKFISFAPFTYFLGVKWHKDTQNITPTGLPVVFFFSPGQVSKYTDGILLIMHWIQVTQNYVQFFLAINMKSLERVNACD